MSLQHFTIGLKLAYINGMKRTHKLKRKLYYYIFPFSREIINYDDFFNENSAVFEVIFKTAEFQLYYVVGNSSQQYLISTYTTLIDDC